MVGIFLMLALAAGLDFLDGLIQRETIVTLCEIFRCQAVRLHFMRLLEYVVLREYRVHATLNGME